MKRCYVMLVVLLVVAVSAQAELIPYGDFTTYRPGTGYTVEAEFLGGAGTSVVFGDGVAVNPGWGDGLATYMDDMTTGTVVDLPGWQSITSNAGNLDVRHGSNAFSAFGGGWGGPVRAQTTADLGVVGTDAITISAMVGLSGGGVPDEFLVLNLMAGTTEVAGGVLTFGAADENGVREIARSFSAAELNAYIGENISIIIGTADGSTGARSYWDNVSMVVPEPATMALLGLGGLFLSRRRKG